jgi:hypothetical protein
MAIAIKELSGLDAWLPEKKAKKHKEPKNIKELFDQYAEEDAASFWGINRTSYGQMVMLNPGYNVTLKHIWTLWTP